MSARHNVSAEEAKQILIAGNERFMDHANEAVATASHGRYKLTNGQSPFAIILNCADSRVVPEVAFDQGLGDIFVVRVAGNIANPSSIASIEYAVAHLGTNLIVVLGHEACGAVGAAIDVAKNPGTDLGPNLNHLVSFITPAVEQTGGGDVAETVKCNANVSADQLVNDSAILKQYVDSGDLKIMPAYYNLGSGKVDFL